MAYEELHDFVLGILIVMTRKCAETASELACLCNSVYLNILYVWQSSDRIVRHIYLQEGIELVVTAAQRRCDGFNPLATI